MAVAVVEDNTHRNEMTSVKAESRNGSLSLFPFPFPFSPWDSAWIIRLHLGLHQCEVGM